MLKIIKIQSFGDIITNSSSEIITIYDRYGVDNIREAIKDIVKALDPKIDINDHIVIDLVPDSSNDYEDDYGNSISFDEYYEQEFNKYCLKHSNDKILLDFPNWLAEFQDTTRTDDNGYPLWTIEIKPITDFGEVLMQSINKILYAFDHEEIYC